MFRTALKFVKREFTNYFYLIYMFLTFLSFAIGFPDYPRNILWAFLLWANYMYIKPRCKEDKVVIVYVMCGVMSIIGFMFSPCPFSSIVRYFFRFYALSKTP
jgi:hypothetical protein